MSAPWKIFGLAAAIALVPLAARAQSADLNTSTPTKNDFRLRVVEPAEGATVAGPNVRVTVANAVPADRAETGTEISKTAPVPRPQISVMLDGREQGQLRDTQNVLTLENVSPGPHKLVVLAKNESGEIIDRKELAFDVSPSGSSSAASASTGANPPATSEATAGSAETTDRGTAPPASSNAPSATTYGSTSSSTSAAETSSTSPENRATSSRATASTAPDTGPRQTSAIDTTANDTTSPRTTARHKKTKTSSDLPKTGTAYPAIALAGAALLAAGFWLRRGAGAS